jgi:hypothetical protein
MLAGALPGTGETGAGGKGAVGATQPPGRIRHASDRASLPTARYTTHPDLGVVAVGLALSTRPLGRTPGRDAGNRSINRSNAIRHAAHSDPAHAVKITIQCMQPPGREWFCASTF